MNKCPTPLSEISHMKWPKFLWMSSVLLATIPAAQAQNIPAKPNILLIVSDDAGYADFGFQGCKDIPTPNLDRLASQGMKFTQGYVAGPVCSPSRAGMLSGKYPARIGHENNLGDGDGGIDIHTPLLPARLKQAGYHTGGIGKWHLGSRPEYVPWQRGFDEFFGFVGGSHNYLASDDKPLGNMVRNGENALVKEYLTDALAREGAAFISKNKDQPWFLYLAFNAVHAPMQADPKMEKLLASIADPKRRELAKMTVSLDNGVGMLLDQLEKSGQADRTLVVFINDNGGATYSKFYNAPLRGHKGTLFEGGIRVPCLMRWPGVIDKAQTYDPPVTGLDLLPTFLAAGGAAPSAWAASDGVNLLPFLKHEQTGQPHTTLYWRFNVVAAVRDGDWKLIRIQDHDPLLFNLANDLAEHDNLATREPERVQALLQKLADWEKPFPPPSWNEGDNWNRIHIQDHIGPPVYQGPGSPATTQE